MIELLLTTLVPALLPVATDGIRGLVGHIFGTDGAKPQNFEELLKLQQFDLEKFKVLAQLDTASGKAASWVYTLRESSRYVAVFVILGMWAIFNLLDGLEAFAMVKEQQETLNSMARSAFFFLFGDRVYINLKKKS